MSDSNAQPTHSCNLCTSVEEYIFNVIELKKGEKNVRKILNNTQLAFLVKGELLVNYGVTKTACLKKKHIYLLPRNLSIEYIASQDSLIVVCHLHPNMEVCNLYSLEHLEKYIEEVSHQNHLPLNKKFLCSLSYGKLMENFVDFLIQAFENGINCLRYQNLKREELFLLMRNTFSPEEIALFLYPILSRDPSFKEFVFANYQDIRDVKEFAELANMSLRNFSRKFKDTFNDTAQNWLKARKAESILYDIVETHLPFTEIAQKHEFSSSSYLTVFCKAKFGKTPATLRKKRKNGI